MAKASWRRDEPSTPPPATFTLELSEDEARALSALLNGGGEVSTIRSDNPAVYAIEDALDNAADMAGVPLY